MTFFYIYFVVSQELSNFIFWNFFSSIRIGQSRIRMAEKYRLNRDPNPEEREKKKRLEAEKLKAIDDDMAKIKSKHDHGVLWTNAEKINAYT